ncbi:MAG: 23S rRNA (uracil(1939)-C(5))-methyltransferase RlmD [Bacteroidota bacterium]|nr:23S rRNA (uracil(1939)-C(5))-methyltransferase RlmD [Bacteroidota bacterium]
MRKKKEAAICEVEITGLGHKGTAVGRTDEGMVVFVQGAVPGDRILVALLKKRKGVWLGKTREVLRYSEHRTEARCQHFGVCGGCSWQNLLYKEQLHQKEIIVRDAFTRIAKTHIGQFEPILEAPEEFEYRNKLEYTFSVHRWLTQEDMQSDEPRIRTGALGFHRPGIFDKIVNIEHCHLQGNLSNDIKNYIRLFAEKNQLSFYDIRNHTGFLRNLIIRVNLHNEILLVLVVSVADQDQLTDLFIELQHKFPQINSAWKVVNSKRNDSLYDLNFEKIFGSDYIIESLHDVAFNISPKSFFQTNTRQAVRLYDLVKSYAALKGNEIVYDLYCGVGSIGIFLAREAKFIIGVEEIAEAIEDAKQNAQLNKLTNCHFVHGDAKNIFNEELIARFGRPDVLILDPPRVGLHSDLILQILEIKADRIVYVSCNPATQARDVSLLLEKYDLVKIRPVDMFPHTNHIESVAQLKLK